MIPVFYYHLPPFSFNLSLDFLLITSVGFIVAQIIFFLSVTLSQGVMISFALFTGIKILFGLCMLTMKVWVDVGGSFSHDSQWTPIPGIPLPVRVILSPWVWAGPHDLVLTNRKRRKGRVFTSVFRLLAFSLWHPLAYCRVVRCSVGRPLWQGSEGGLQPAAPEKLRPGSSSLPPAGPHFPAGPWGVLRPAWCS